MQSFRTKTDRGFKIRENQPFSERPEPPCPWPGGRSGGRPSRIPGTWCKGYLLFSPPKMAFSGTKGRPGRKTIGQKERRERTGLWRAPPLLSSSCLRLFLRVFSLVVAQRSSIHPLLRIAWNNGRYISYHNVCRESRYIKQVSCTCHARDKRCKKLPCYICSIANVMWWD